ncbi:ABC transporter substrate-binding protein [Noviherbaspirillum saxi]|nr:ABC transporter substrate-binding protein [Noviherbaspirillum saxi]
MDRREKSEIASQNVASARRKVLQVRRAVKEVRNPVASSRNEIGGLNMRLNVFRAMALVTAMCMVGGALGETVVVGQVAPLGAPGSPGNQLRLGAQVYFDAINRAGGVHGMTLKLVSRDRGLRNGETVTTTRKLVQETEPLALLGLVGTGPMEELVASGLLAESGLPVVGIRTGAVSLHKPTNPYLFHIRTSYAGEIEKILTQLTTIGFNRVSVFYENSSFGKEGMGLVQRIIKNKPAMQLAGQATYEPGTTDVREAAKNLAMTKSQGVIAVANSAATAEFYREYRQIEKNAQVLALSTVDSAEVVKRIGPASAKGLIVTQVVPDATNTTIPLVRELHKYVEKFGPAEIAIDQTVVEGYLSAKVLVEALRVAGPKPTRKKICSALNSIKYFDAGGVIIDFSPSNHTGSRYAELAIVLKNGKLMR